MARDILKRLSATCDALLAAVNQLRDEIRTNTQKASKAADEQYEHAKAAKASLGTDLKLIEAAIGQHAANQQRKYPGIRAAGEALTLLLLAAGTVVAVQSLRELTRSIDQARRSADAAHDAVTLARNTMRIEQRAFVYVETIRLA